MKAMILQTYHHSNVSQWIMSLCPSYSQSKFLDRQYHVHLGSLSPHIGPMRRTGYSDIFVLLVQSLCHNSSLPIMNTMHVTLSRSRQVWPVDLLLHPRSSSFNLPYPRILSRDIRCAFPINERAIQNVPEFALITAS